MIKEAITYLVGSYLIDVSVRSALAAKVARAYADKVGKPLLNVGAGTEGLDREQCMAIGNSVCYPPQLVGDVNVDIGGRKDVPHGTKGIVTYADAEHLPFPDASFGAVLSTHMLEHVERPDLALAEMRRVTGNDPGALFVVTPSWWAPHVAWAPWHLWYFPDGAGGTKDGRAVRLR